MSQGDQFHQYGYDHYLKAPTRKGASSRSSVHYGGDGLLSSLLYSLGTSALLRKLQSPVIAGGSLFVAVLLFSGVVMMTYSSDDGASEPIPIIKADLSNIKQAPSNPGGMDIPNRESTILARGDQPSVEAQTKSVENLLASQSHEDLISKEEAFNRATQSPIMGDENAVISFADSAEAQDDLAALQAQAGGAVDVLSYPRAGVSSEGASSEIASSGQSLSVSSNDVSSNSSSNSKSVSSSPLVASQLDASSVFELEKPAAGDILQKIGSTKRDDSSGNKSDHFSQAFVSMAAKAAVAGKPSSPVISSASLLSTPVKSSKTIVASAATTSKPTYSNLHSAGQSPETLDYVRSVLDKSSHDSGGVRVQDIEPALGTSEGASTNIELSAGSYFVQLASITDARRAHEEWSKMQNKYSVLASSRFRVQEASLPGGTFYRIQAGPMAKGSANQVCDSLKQSNKPGGCLVVK